jgi:hypothetical protein
MRRVRRAYYDTFSRFYDRFVALHSRDTQGHLNCKFLVRSAAGFLEPSHQLVHGQRDRLDLASDQKINL